jgi:cytochrome P450
MDAFTPFSYGPANCVGKFLALQEMKTVVCHMIQKLDMRFADGYDARRWFEDLEEQAIFMKGSLPVVIARRERKVGQAFE